MAFFVKPIAYLHHLVRHYRVMSFAPGEGPSETTFMFPRLPVAPRYSRARMSSMARSTVACLPWSGRQGAGEPADPCLGRKL
jgi:hypothetical protein